MSLFYQSGFLLHVQSFFTFSVPSTGICFDFCLIIHILQELKYPTGKATCSSDCRFFKIEAHTASAHWVAPDTAPCPTSAYGALAQLCRRMCQCWRSARVTGQSLGSQTDDVPDTLVIDTGEYLHRDSAQRPSRGCLGRMKHKGLSSTHCP